MNIYIGSLLMISAGLIGCQPLLPEAFSNIIKKLAPLRIILGIILFVGTIYAIIHLTIRGFNLGSFPPFGVLLLIIYLISFPLIVGFIFSYDFVIRKLGKTIPEKFLDSEKITNLKTKMSKFETLFSAGLFFQGIFYFLGSLSIESIINLIFKDLMKSLM
tara:strand:+ start:7642 stop:8121 length:480 start_codon:yes stop_codon:yes gene_type:complete